jgi:hypothetical protein
VCPGQLRVCFVGRLLWREVGSVVFSCFWASPAQSFSALSPAGLMNIFYCLKFWDSPSLECQVPVCISHRNRIVLLYPQALGSVWVSSPPELKTIFYCLIWDSPNLQGQVPVFKSARNGWPSYTPVHWVSFSSPLTTRRATVEVL